MEKVEPGLTLGRQIATYALLVGVPYETDIDRFSDILVTDHGYRSITGVPVPFHVPGARLKELQALPGIGKKRAAHIKAADAHDVASFAAAVDDGTVVKALTPHLRF
jgi:radical SAM superfamily enzyme with C-terminal helix-hairpin-helix motif